MSASESETMRDRPVDCSQEARRIRSLLESREKELRRLESVLRDLECRLGVAPLEDSKPRLEGAILPASVLDGEQGVPPRESSSPTAPRRDPALVELADWCGKAGERLDAVAAALPVLATRLDQVTERMVRLDESRWRLQEDLFGGRVRRMRILLLAVALIVIASAWWAPIFS